MFTVDRHTELQCSPEAAWEAVQTLPLLQRVCWPLIRFAPTGNEPLPRQWQKGMVCQVRIFLLGFIPLGPHTLRFVRMDQKRREIETEEGSWLVRRWHHTVSVETSPTGGARYRDHVEIDAGMLTGLVGRFANLFYGHRQRRWRKVAQELADSMRGETAHHGGEVLRPSRIV